MATKVIFIEFRGRRPWGFVTYDGNIFLSYDVEYSVRAKGWYYHCSGAGLDPCVDGRDRSRWWLAQDHCVKFSCPNASGTRMKKPPRGKFSPEQIMNSLCGGDGDWCSECGDFIPSDCEHDDGCPAVSR